MTMENRSAGRPAREAFEAARKARHDTWPINEIRLATQVRAGKSDAEIAADHGVDWRAVRSLRTSFGL